MSTVARPYVAAAFEYALEHKDLPAWETFLEAAALVASDARVAAILHDPAKTTQQVADFFFEVLTKFLNESRRRFIHLLAERHRLAVLPAIAVAFAQKRADQEARLSVEVISAVPLDANNQQALQHALSLRFKREIEMQCTVNPEVIGGVMVRAGDEVLDGTVRGKLDRLRQSI